MDPSAPEKKRIPYLLKYSLMLILLFLLSLAILRTPILHDSFPELNAEHASEREPFPNLELIDLNGDKNFIKDFQDHVVLITFWASWCGPCLEELPIFAKLAKIHPSQLKVIAINQDDSPKVKKFIDEFWQKHDIPFQNYYDPIHKLGEQMNIEVLPSNFVIDKKGRLAFASFGVNNWMGHEAQDFFQQLIKE